MLGMRPPPSLLRGCCLLLLLVGPGIRSHPGEHVLPGAGDQDYLEDETVASAAKQDHLGEKTVPRADDMGQLGEQAVQKAAEQGPLGEQPVPRAAGKWNLEEKAVHREQQRADHGAGKQERLGEQFEPKVGVPQTPRAGKPSYQGEKSVFMPAGKGHQEEKAGRVGEQHLPRAGGHPGLVEKVERRVQEQSLSMAEGQGHLVERAASRIWEQGLPRAGGQDRLVEKAVLSVGQHAMPRAGGHERTVEKPELGAGGQGPSGPRQGMAERHMEVVLDFSRRCWHYVTHELWHPECSNEDGARGPGWSLPLMGQAYLEMLSSWYCRVWECKPWDCQVYHNMTGLDVDLHRRLHGQHLAREIILKRVPSFVRDRQPDKALTLSFHGWSGTGKNFVARLMAENLYRDGMKSNCVKLFITQLHFPHARYVELYKVQLKKHLSDTIGRCKKALFIFDEAEKLHPALVATIRPYVARGKETGIEDYRQAIFLFLSNIGGNAINEVARNFWRAGRQREEITLADLERPLRAEMSRSQGDEFAHSQLLIENLIDALVPFLPLEYKHVKLCARDAFLARGLHYTEEDLDEVARMMVFVPKQEKLFSASGCKSVIQRIHYL